MCLLQQFLLSTVLQDFLFNFFFLICKQSDSLTWCRYFTLVRQKRSCYFVYSTLWLSGSFHRHSIIIIKLVENILNSWFFVGDSQVKAVRFCSFLQSNVYVEIDLLLFKFYFLFCKVWLSQAGRNVELCQVGLHVV